MVTDGKLNWMCISEGKSNSVVEFMMHFMEHLVQRQVLVFAMEESVNKVKCEIFTNAKDQQLFDKSVSVRETSWIEIGD